MKTKISQNQRNEMFARCVLYPIFVLVNNHLTTQKTVASLGGPCANFVLLVLLLHGYLFLYVMYSCETLESALELPKLYSFVDERNRKEC